MTYILGLDDSHWQSSFRWADVKDAGYRFAWHKASQGRSGRDGTFPGRRTCCGLAGMRPGAYHFCDLGQDPVDNARNFWGAVGEIKPGELWPAADVEGQGIPEGMSAADAVAWCLAFAAAAPATAADDKRVFYTDHGTLVNRLGGGTPELVQRFPFLWLARYTGASTPGTTGAWPCYAAWQFTQSGHINGGPGPLDLDRIPSEDVLCALTKPDPNLDGPGE